MPDVYIKYRVRFGSVYPTQRTGLEPTLSDFKKSEPSPICDFHKPTQSDPNRPDRFGFSVFTDRMCTPILDHWHRRLGHISSARLKLLTSSGALVLYH